MTAGVEVVFVTVTVPLAFVTTRIGATRRPPAARVAVGEPVVVVDDVVDDAVVVVACVKRRLPRGGLAARVGLGSAADVSVGVRRFVLAALVGVAVIAAVVGVAAVFVSVGAGVAIEAIVGVGVVPMIVGPAVVPVVAPTDTAAVVPVEAITTPPPPSPPVMTGIGSELMDAFTVACGLA
jgi:hypothetical protein